MYQLFAALCGYKDWLCTYAGAVAKGSTPVPQESGAKKVGLETLQTSRESGQKVCLVINVQAKGLSPSSGPVRRPLDRRLMQRNRWHG